VSAGSRAVRCRRSRSSRSVHREPRRAPAPCGRKRSDRAATRYPDEAFVVQPCVT
jgi:hypothetical protein